MCTDLWYSMPQFINHFRHSLLILTISLTAIVVATPKKSRVWAGPVTCFLLLAHSSSGTALLLRLVPDKPCRVHLSLLELNVEEGSRNTCGPSTLRPACCEEEVHTERQKNAYPAPSSSSHPSPCERRSLQRIQSITIIKKSLSEKCPAESSLLRITRDNYKLSF